MEALKVVFSDGAVDLCIPSTVNVPVDTVLKKGLYPFSASTLHRTALMGTFKINDEVIKGFPISNNLRELIDFWEKYSVDKKVPRQLQRYDYEFDDFIEFAPIKGFVHCERIVVENKTYLFLPAGTCVVYSWEEKDRTIQPVLCGMINTGEEKIYFYYTGYTKENAILRRTDHLEKVPHTIMESLRKRYGYCGIQQDEVDFESGPRRKLYGVQLIRERYARVHRDLDFVDVNPYPPYQIVHAVKLLPPEELDNSKNPIVPTNFTENYLLRTFLYTCEPIPFSVLSADEIRGIANYVHSTFYFYNMQTENPIGEYTEIWENSCGYLLFCKPIWPF